MKFNQSRLAKLKIQKALVAMPPRAKKNQAQQPVDISSAQTLPQFVQKKTTQPQ
jgi:hypothetical protein